MSHLILSLLQICIELDTTSILELNFVQAFVHSMPSVMLSSMAHSLLQLKSFNIGKKHARNERYFIRAKRQKRESSKVSLSRMFRPKSNMHDRF